MPRRQSPDAVVTMGMDEPLQVLKPSELLEVSERNSTITLQTAPAINEPNLSSEQFSLKPPVRDYKLSFPEWEMVDFQIEEAQSITSSGPYVRPVWSPVGLDIAYSRDNYNELFITGPIGGMITTQLASDRGIGEDFAWSPDGMSVRARGQDGQYAEFLITGERYPIGSPEPKVVEQDDGIYIRENDATLRRVSGFEDKFMEPSLSPDEQKIVYRGRQTGLYIALANGTRAIYVGPGQNARWSPDSSAIVYDLPMSDGRTIVDGDIWFASVDGRRKANLTATPGIVESHPAISPDGQRIAFAAAGIIYVGKLSRPTP